MVREEVKAALLAIDEGELSKLARLADRLLAGHPIFTEGAWRHRYRSGRGKDFLDFREYVPGDDMRAVDWRASARSRDLLVRRYHDDSSSRWYVCLDRSASMSIGNGEKWLLAVKLAAVFLYLLLHRTNRGGLLAYSTEIDAHCPTGRGRRQYERVLALLAKTTPRLEGGGSSLHACARRLGRKCSAIVISDFLSADGLPSGLDSILGLGGQVHAVQVLSSTECQVGLAGAAVLQDVESGDQLVVGSGQGDPQLEAEGRLRELRSDLASYCRRHNIAFTTSDTGKEWQTIVIEHLVEACGGHA